MCLLKINVGIIKIQKSRNDGIMGYKNTKFADTKKIKPFYNDKAPFFKFDFDCFFGMFR